MSEVSASLKGRAWADEEDSGYHEPINMEDVTQNDLQHGALTAEAFEFKEDAEKKEKGKRKFPTAVETKGDDGLALPP
eukprot:12056425-Karenia_brevis.AAC.1